MADDPPPGGSPLLRVLGSSERDQIRFWLRELRTPSLLIEAAARWPDETRQQISTRPLLEHALARDKPSLETALSAEEQAERLRDKDYWLPLKKELEAMRRER